MDTNEKRGDDGTGYVRARQRRASCARPATTQHHNQVSVRVSEKERERESVGIAVLLLRYSNPSRQLAPYGHILRDILSHSRSKKMMNIQARPLRVSAASEELHIAATRNINTIHQINSDALQTTQNSPR